MPGSTTDVVHSRFYPVDVSSPVSDRYRVVVDLIKRYRPIESSAILEIGPERPAVSRYVIDSLCVNSKDYQSVESSEVSRNALQNAGISVELVDVSNEDLPFDDRRFDVIIGCEVIEHLTNPERLLRECRRVLRPNGILVCTTPNLAAWFNRFILAAGRQPIFTETGSEWVFGRAPFAAVARPVGHLHLYTLGAFVELLGHCGLDVTFVSGLPSAEVTHRHRFIRGLDRIFSHWTGLAASLVVGARPHKSEPHGERAIEAP